MIAAVDHVDVRAHWRRVCPSVPMRSVERLGAGTDHHAFVVNAELVLRVAIEPGDAELDHERRILALAAARSSLPVPEVVAGDAEAIVTRLIPGTSLFDLPVPAGDGLADQLTAFLDGLHSTPAGDMATVLRTDRFAPVDAWEEAVAHRAVVEPALTPARRAAMDAFLGSAPPAPVDRVCFCHGDLGAEHLLVDDRASTIVGVIDWSDAAAIDPARDLARLLRDLPGRLFERIESGYRFTDPGLDPGLAERTRFYARCFLLEDLAFAAQTDRTEYRDHALRRFDAVFAD
jgi:aminoglycoside phosphotransferase (APT) family kinase protein